MPLRAVRGILLLTTERNRAVRVMKATLRWPLWCLLVFPFILSSCDSTEEDGIRVIAYEGSLITENSVEAPWLVAVNNDVVTLTVEEENEVLKHQIVLRNIPGIALPVGPSYTRRPGTDSSFVLLRGVVAIQDWDVNGVMSGVVRGDLSRPGSPTPSGAKTEVFFWVDRSTP